MNYCSRNKGHPPPKYPHPARTDESAEVASFEYAQMPKEHTGDFSLKIGQSYIYNKYPNILKDGVPYVEAQYFLEENRGAETSLSGDKLTIKLADMEFVLTAGQTKYEYKKGIFLLKCLRI